MHDCTEEEGGREREIGDCDDDRRSASDFLRAAGGGVAQIKRKKIEEHHEEHEGEGGGVEGESLQEKGLVLANWFELQL